MRLDLGIGGYWSRRTAIEVAAGVGVAFVSLFAWTTAARSDVVRDFSFQLKEPRAHGAYTVTYSERSFDTTGVAVPPVTRYSLRFPLGMSIRREILKRRLLCDSAKLRLEKDRRVCKRAQIGRGRAEAELLDVSDDRLTSVPIPANLYFFLGKSTTKGAVAAMWILAVPDASAPIVRDNPSVRNARLVGEAPYFVDPTPDGLFGYRLELPPALGGLRYNAAKGDFAFPGFTITRRVRTCVAPRRGSEGAATCRRKKSQTEKIFWITRPKCPSSGKLTFQATYNYAVLPSMTLNHEIPCPEFVR